MRDPTISEDGQWKWNGSEWKPNVPNVPPQMKPPSPKRGHKRRNILLGVLAIVVLFVGLCSYAVANSPTNKQQIAQGAADGSRAANPTAKPSTAPVPPKPVTPVVMTEKVGSGISKTDAFDAPGQWTFKYQFQNCNGGSSNFIVTERSDSGVTDVLANQIAANGSDIVQIHQSGHLWLEILSGCDWHVWATNP